jgi:hypothetical protein
MFQRCVVYLQHHRPDDGGSTHLRNVTIWRYNPEGRNLHLMLFGINFIKIYFHRWN